MIHFLRSAACPTLQSSGAPGFASLFAPSFASPAPPGAPPPAPLARVPAAGGPDVGREIFASALAAYLGGVPLIRRCDFKPYQFDLEVGGRRARADCHLDLGGLAPDGSRVSDVGDAEVVLAGGQGTWRFERLSLGSRTRATGLAPTFFDVTEAIGVWRTFPDGAAPPLAQGGQNADAGGLAVVDYDGDGDLDIYVGRAGPNLLFRNDGETFREVAAEAGVADPGDARGVLFADLDNDGDLDLFIANNDNPQARIRRGNAVYRNDGRGRFSDLTAGAGVGPRGAYRGVISADFDNDGLLDLYVAQYQYYGRPIGNLVGSHHGRPNLLLHNRGGLRFRDVAGEAGVDGSEWSYAAAAADFDGDRLPELLVVNDYGAERLFHNLGRLRFEDVTAPAGIADPGNGMGVDVGDVDGDGNADIYLSNMYSSAGNRILGLKPSVAPTWLAAARNAAAGNSLFLHQGGLVFRDGAVAGEGRERVRRAGWAWSTEMADVDNDGDLDIHVTNGYLTKPSADDY